MISIVRPRPQPPARRSRADAWRRRRRRTTVAVVLALAAVLVLAVAIRPGPPPQRSVVVAARDLPAGHRIAPQDVRVVQRSVTGGPTPAGSTRTVTGRFTTGPVGADEPLTPARHAADPWPDLGPGEVAVWVPLADSGMVAGLSSGSRIDVHRAESGDPLARRVRVMSTTLGDDAASVVVAAPKDVGSRIAAAVVGSDAAGSGIAVTVHRRG